MVLYYAKGRQLLLSRWMDLFCKIIKMLFNRYVPFSTDFFLFLLTSNHSFYCFSWYLTSQFGELSFWQGLMPKVIFLKGHFTRSFEDSCGGICFILNLVCRRAQSPQVYYWGRAFQSNAWPVATLNYYMLILLKCFFPSTTIKDINYKCLRSNFYTEESSITFFLNFQNTEK